MGKPLVLVLLALAVGASALGLLLFSGRPLPDSSGGQVPEPEASPPDVPTTGPGTGLGPAAGGPGPKAALPAVVARALARSPAEISLALEDLRPWADTVEGVVALLELLRGSDDPGLRSLVVVALGRSQLDAARNAVIGAARGDLGDDVRVPGLLSLGLDPDDEATEVLYEAGAGATDPAVFSASLQALAIQATPKAQAALARTIRATTDPSKRRQFWTVLRGEPLSGGTEEPGITRTIRSEAHGNLVELPGDPDSENAIREIVGEARSERTREGRMLAASALLLIQSDQTTAPFLEMWSEMDRPMLHGLIGRADPMLSASKVPGMLETGSRMEDAGVRRILALRAGDLAGPDETARLEEWMERERDGEVKKALSDSIARLRERQ